MASPPLLTTPTPGNENLSPSLHAVIA